MWLAIILLPWKPYSTREHLDRCHFKNGHSLGEVTVLIPARNEALTLKESLPSVLSQGPDLKVIVVDDCSEDDTSLVAKDILGSQGEVIKGRPCPEGWSGKLWALEQGLAHVKTPFVLLMDADILLEDGILYSALSSLKELRVDMVSLMAWLRMDNLVEKLFMPAFIYFFKLLYPFKLANGPSRLIAAAAGGFILVKSDTLRNIGAFSSIKEAIIDDCTLARSIKKSGGRIFIGLTKCVRSIRQYSHLADIWQMVSRTAYTQLHYNPALLVVATLLMVVAFVVPIVGLFSSQFSTTIISFSALFVMFVSYLPVLRYYNLSPILGLTLPFVAFLYLAMTWSSAWQHYFGKGVHWRGRYIKH